jgi:Cu/Ag efflux pump CusA
MGRQNDDRVSVDIRGHDLTVASDLAKTVKDVIESVPGVADATISRREGMPEMLVTVDRTKAASVGVNASDVADTLEAVIGGRQASQEKKATSSTFWCALPRTSAPTLNTSSRFPSSPRAASLFPSAA